MDHDTETQQKRTAGLLSKDALTTRLQVLADPALLEELRPYFI